MSSDERARRRDESEGTEPDVAAHRYVTEEPAEDDPDRKRRRKQSEEPETDEAGKRKK